MVLKDVFVAGSLVIIGMYMLTVHNFTQDILEFWSCHVHQDTIEP